MKNDGGPAFPSSWDGRVLSDEACNQIGGWEQGMSLRDWFAGQALIGIMRGKTGMYENRFNPNDDAKWCYELADAMLAARAKQEEQG